jgi:hypothetical protein
VKEIGTVIIKRVELTEAEFKKLKSGVIEAEHGFTHSLNQEAIDYFYHVGAAVNFIRGPSIYRTGFYVQASATGVITIGEETSVTTSVWEIEFVQE